MTKALINKTSKMHKQDKKRRRFTWESCLIFLLKIMQILVHNFDKPFGGACFFYKTCNKCTYIKHQNVIIQTSEIIQVGSF